MSRNLYLVLLQCIHGPMCQLCPSPGRPAVLGGGTVCPVNYTVVIGAVEQPRGRLRSAGDAGGVRAAAPTLACLTRAPVRRLSGTSLPDAQCTSVTLCTVHRLWFTVYSLIAMLALSCVSRQN